MLTPRLLMTLDFIRCIFEIDFCTEYVFQAVRCAYFVGIFISKTHKF